MADAVEANWHGHDYQARMFWLFASALRDPEQPHVVEVTYEANGPKAFDDVVVRYKPGRQSSGPQRITVDYHQIKWHVSSDGRFGYQSLIDPAFIGAKQNSILQRLQSAKATAPPEAAFKLVTTDRISDGDPLSTLVSKKDHSLLLERLFDGTTDHSKMGKVRKLWREHLGLSSNEELRALLTGLHIVESHFSLEDLRVQVNMRLRLVGLVPCQDAVEFKYDGAARALKVKGINRLTRESFEAICQEEKWISTANDLRRRNIAIRSFAAMPSDNLETPSDQSLELVKYFEGRFLESGADWNSDIRPQVVEFLESQMKLSNSIRLYIDAHLSFAFLAGSVLHLKSGADVEIVQKGRAGTRIWNVSDAQTGPSLSVRHLRLSDAAERAVAVSITRSADDDVERYVRQHLPAVGTLYFFTPALGAAQNAVKGGAHAAQLADQIANFLAAQRVVNSVIHLFLAAPNGFAFLLGQQKEALGTCLLYEFDFSGARDFSYKASFQC